MKKASSSSRSSKYESGDDSSSEGDSVFTGIKSEWTNFENLLRGRLQRSVGPQGIKYLFTNAGLDDPTFMVRDIPPSLEDDVSVDTTQPDGTIVAVPVTSEMRKERRELRKAIRDDNEMVHNLEIKCMKHIQLCVGKHIKQKLVSFGGDPIASWAYLKETYGPESQGPLDTAFSFTRLMFMKMEHGEMFADFMIKFEEIKNYCQLPDGCALGLLLTDGTNELKLRMLPLRFSSDIEYAKRNKMTYKKFKKYMIQQDSQAHEQGLGREEKVSNVLAVSRDTKCSSLLCYNCGNDGPHYAKDCKLDACSYCKKFECGHTRNDCPRRLKVGKTTKGEDHGKASRSADRHQQVKKDKKITKKQNKTRKRQASSSEEEDAREEMENSSSEEELAHSPEKKKSSKKRKIQFLKKRKSESSEDEDIWDPPGVRRA
jgi:hypothetical protein